MHFKVNEAESDMRMNLLRCRANPLHSHRAQNVSLVALTHCPRGKWWYGYGHFTSQVTATVAVVARMRFDNRWTAPPYLHSHIACSADHNRIRHHLYVCLFMVLFGKFLLLIASKSAIMVGLTAHVVCFRCTKGV
uniref:Uncharacterized protein n=1 Tax=Anopheles farauti TaxID=69004 RepID=A0A182QDK6_9DIPT